MNDLISRKAAYTTLTEYYHHTTEMQHKALREALERVPSAETHEKRTETHSCDCIDQIDREPTIEPRCETCEAFNKTRLLIPQPERKKGKWINIRHDNVAECDQCGITGRAWMNFCFDCGADMRTPVETARDIVHKAIDNSVWSDTVDTAKMHNVVDDKYVEMTKKTEESKRCDTCKHEKARWFSRCADCSDYELWEGKEE